MGSDIRPGMRVRVTRGMYACTHGVVIALGGPDGNRWASLDVDPGRIGVHVSDLAPEDAPTLRDRVTAVLEAASAQRDREAELAGALPDDEAVTHEYAHALLEETIAALTQALEEGS